MVEAEQVFLQELNHSIICNYGRQDDMKALLQGKRSSDVWLCALVAVSQEMDREDAGHLTAGMGDAGTERPVQVSARCRTHSPGVFVNNTYYDATIWTKFTLIQIIPNVITKTALPGSKV